MIITQEIVREFLDYDPETGKLTWQERDRKWFKSDHDFNSWNTRFAEKEAFTSINGRGYCNGAIFGKNYRAHRIIWLYMTGEFPEDQIDHINHDKTDNKWYNLREVSNQENCKNQSKSKNNTCGYTGIHWNKQNQKWIARINIGSYNRICLGSFDLLCEAVSARKAAELKYGFHENHGETTS
jgi:hypothetical protein